MNDNGLKRLTVHDKEGILDYWETIYKSFPANAYVTNACGEHFCAEAILTYRFFRELFESKNSNRSVEAGGYLSNWRPDKRMAELLSFYLEMHSVDEPKPHVALYRGILSMDTVAVYGFHDWMRKRKPSSESENNWDYYYWQAIKPEAIEPEEEIVR